MRNSDKALQSKPHPKSGQGGASSFKADGDEVFEATNTGLSVAGARLLRVKLDALREAAVDLDATMEDLKGAGLDPDALLEALRIEHTDWSKNLIRMQNAKELLDAMGCHTRLDALILIDEPISTFDDRNEWTRDMGRLHYSAGRYLKDNPFKAGTNDHMNWRFGWIDAKRSEKSAETGAG